VIKSFRHRGLQKFYETGSKAGIQPKHATKLLVQLTVLDQAIAPDEMDIAGWLWHELKGDQKGRWAVKVNGNWRLTFEFEGRNAILVDYEDYH
jgi:proteic killer suppression protein